MQQNSRKDVYGLLFHLRFGGFRLEIEAILVRLNACGIHLSLDQMSGLQFVGGSAGVGRLGEVGTKGFGAQPFLFTVQRAAGNRNTPDTLVRLVHIPVGLPLIRTISTHPPGIASLPARQSEQFRSQAVTIEISLPLVSELYSDDGFPSGRILRKTGQLLRKLHPWLGT